MSLLVKIKNELLPCGRVVGCARAINALRKHASQFCNPRSLAAEYNMDAKHVKSLAVHLEQIFRALTTYTSTVGAAVGAYEHPHAMDLAILEE